VVVLLTAVGTHWLDQRNWVSQHREERLDARRQEAKAVFDTTIVSLSRITTSLNPLLWGLEHSVARDSVLKLEGTYDRNVYAFESQAARLQSLIGVYFDNLTLHQFYDVLRAAEAMEYDATAYLATPPKRPISPQTLREFTNAVLTLSDHMAEQLAK